ncbi:MAG: hypothetical protein V4647_15335 [Pseudomonadota bacterium]
MASIAHDSDRSNGAGSGKSPISTHPAFPFIVALWFAALLGIGSLVVPVQVVEQIILTTGLSSIIPQAAPPLGFTATALIALTCTVAGGLAGLLIARKVAQAHRAPAPARFSSTVAAARRPISAHDELGEDGFDGNAPRGRRTLAIAEEEKPSEVFELAPLPGKHLPLSAIDLNEVEALDLADEDELFLAEPDLDPASPIQPGFTSLIDAPVTGDYVMHDRQQFAFPAAESRQQFFVPAEAEAIETVPTDEPAVAVADEAEADIVFSPPSLARAFDAPVAAEDAGEMVEEAELPEPEMAEPEMVEPEMPEPEQFELASPSDAASAAPAEWQDGELDDLALVQLAQRLGSSIARRREARAAQEAAAAAAAAAAVVQPVVASAPAAVPLPAMLAEEFDAAEAAEAAKAMAAYFGGPAATADEPVAEVAEPEPAPVQPAAGRQMFQPVAQASPAAIVNPLAGLARIDLGEEDEDDDDGIAHLTASFSLPLARPAMAEAEPEIEIEPEIGAESDTFVPVSTLGPAVTPANPFQSRVQTFVRIENEPQPEDGAVEPAVVFPGENPFAAPEAAAHVAPAAQQPRVNADENERALREALLNLQRMSSVG